MGILANIILFNLDGLNRLNPSLQISSDERSNLPAKPLDVARSLRILGIKQGDKVGVLGYAYDSFWARLARVKIVAEMLESDSDNSWLKDQELQHEILDVFASTGTKAVVAENVPQRFQMRDWHRVGDSSYYIYVFPEQ
jgi:hypothetical protein